MLLKVRNCKIGGIFGCSKNIFYFFKNFGNIKTKNVRIMFLHLFSVTFFAIQTKTMLLGLDKLVK